LTTSLIDLAGNFYYQPKCVTYSTVTSARPTVGLVHEAGGQMVVYHAGGLHKGIAYGASDESKTYIFQFLANLI
jgi:hypothetical protein